MYNFILMSLLACNNEESQESSTKANTLPAETMEGPSYNTISDVIQAAIEDSDTGNESTESQEEDISEWTFMVFINGDSDLEYAGIDDINEMEVTGSSEDVQIIVQYDRSEGFATEDGDWHGARRYRIEQDDSENIGSPVLEDLGVVDSGDYNTVVDFVEWTAERYPAKKYALVVWNHGASWYFQPNEPQKGISVDYDTGSIISVANGDFSRMLSDVYDILGQKIEMLGMDACIMQSWEIAYEAAPFANYFVASQDYEGFDGWNYEGTMADLVEHPAMNGEDLGSSVGLRFIETGDLTQSTIDLRRLNELNTKLNQFAEEFIENPEFSTYQQSVERSYSYDGEWGVDHDMRGFLSTFTRRAENERLRVKAQEAIDVLDRIVLSNYTHDDLSGANGLSIYSPSIYLADIDTSYLNATWSEETKWDDMLLAVFEQ